MKFFWTNRDSATPRQRYEWEYRQDRLYNSYYNSSYNFEGLKGLREGYESYVASRTQRFTGWMNDERRRYFAHWVYINTGRVSGSDDIPF